MTKALDFCKLKFRTSELERCKLPKTCFETCEINYGPTSGQYRRVQVFGGGDGIQSQGMDRFTGTNPNTNSQPWLGNAQGAITNSSGGAHFYDRSGGRNARESMSYETYIYIPSRACGPTVTLIRFRSLGEQFAQIRISPAGGNLNAATVVGTVNYLGPPNTRNIGGSVNVVQDTVYGVLGYSLDRQDNADIEIQYNDGTGTWRDIPHAWMHANLADAQAAESLQTFWCVQGGIATNETDDRRITEVELQTLQGFAEVPCDDPVADVQAQVTALEDKLNQQVRLVYRLTPETPDQMTVRRWLQPPDSVTHDNVANIWTGPIDPVTNHPSHPNPPTSVAGDDWNYNGPDDQMEGFGYIEVLTPIWVRDNNANTGERGLVRYQECCGDWQTLQETNTDTPATDRGVLDPTLLQPGIHFLWVGTSDVTANQGFDLEWSATETGTYANFSTYEGRKWTEKPKVECLEVGFCDPTPEGYDEKPPEMCVPVFVPAEESGLSQEEVEALITPHPDQEICTGDFVDVSTRAGWTHTWTPTYTASTGTVVEQWVQVGTAETAPDCLTDITVNGTLGNSYMQTRNMWGRVWYDVRLLINGAAVTTYTFQNYQYEDDIGETKLADEIDPLGSYHFARNNVPAGATITVEILRRHNFVAGNAAIASPFGRVISGLRAHFNVHYSPTQIVTGRV